MEQEILKSMHENMQMHMTCFAPNHPHLRLLDEPDVIAVQSDLPGDFYNYILAAQFDKEQADARIDALFKQYVGREFSWWVSLSCDRPSTLPQLLLNHGLSPTESEVGMYKYLKGGRGHAAISRVEDKESLRGFANVIVSIGAPPQLYEVIYAPLDLSALPLELYVLHDEGRIVTTGVVVFHADVAGIYYICTHPDYRRRGFGMQMMEHLLARAHEKGHAIATLQASKQGEPLYKKMDFRTLCHFQEFGWK